MIDRLFNFAPGAVPFASNLFGWPYESWSAVGWAVAIAFSILLIVTVSLVRRLYILESEREPRVSIEPHRVERFNDRQTAAPTLWCTVRVRALTQAAVPDVRIQLVKVEHKASGASEFEERYFYGPEDIQWQTPEGFGPRSVSQDGEIARVFSITATANKLDVKWQKTHPRNLDLFAGTGSYRLTVKASAPTGLACEEQITIYWPGKFDGAHIDGEEKFDVTRQIPQS